MKLFSKLHDAVIGKVLAPHGLDGVVKVYPYTDFPERIKLLDEVELLFDSERRKMLIDKASLSNRFWLIKFKSIETREQAETIRDSLVLIAKQDRLPLKADSYYHDQLVGLAVYTAEGIQIGTVIDIINTGGHDLLQVESGREDEKKFLVPVVKKFIDRVDLQEGRIIVQLPEGLLEL